MPEYTKEDYAELRSILESIVGNDKNLFYVLEKSFLSTVNWNKTGEDFKKEIEKLGYGDYSMCWILYEAPFIKMPLYLYHKNLYYRQISRFRLRVGK